MQKLLLVFIGGGVGSVLRYAISLLIPTKSNGLALATLLVNVLGSFIIGFLLTKSNLQESTRLLLAVGLCGGFTTFSSFAYESMGILNNGTWWHMVGYAILSMVLCLLAVKLGMELN